MPDATLHHPFTLGSAKFRDPDVTAKGEPRAFVRLSRLKTLWFNTGSLCNIACQGCYIESSPTNDRLAYLTLADVRSYLDEIAREGFPVEEIAFTGGEPFLNRELPEMLGESLARGYRVLVLTNAMKPLHNRKRDLLTLNAGHGPTLTLRVSIDHYSPDKHEALRGRGAWRPMMDGVRWLAENGFRITIAGRTLWDEEEGALRNSYAALFARERIPVDASDPAALVLFPEMDPSTDVPEISVRCWRILGVSPDAMMCASSRMVIKRKGAASPVIVPCTLLPYDRPFELGPRLTDAQSPIKLNHPFCAQFCVLGGGSCSAQSREPISDGSGNPGQSTVLA